MDVEIATGVMHQIRAHLAFLGHPLAGDPCMAAPGFPGLPRHFLHAARLGFAHPDGTRPRYDSALPPDLTAVLAALYSTERVGSRRIAASCKSATRSADSRRIDASSSSRGESPRLSSFSCACDSTVLLGPPTRSVLYPCACREKT